jgi:hypothetical protein
LVLEFSKLFGVGTFGESDNFLKDLNIRFVDGLGSWDPVFVDSGGELFFGWGNSFGVVDDISSDFSTEVFVFLGSSSPVIGNLLWVLEFKSSWSFSGSWGEFALSNLVLPGSGVHVLDVLTGNFPFSSIFLKGSSGSSGVFKVSSDIFLNVIFESESLVDVLIHLSSDDFSFLLLSIGDERFWGRSGNSIGLSFIPFEGIIAFLGSSLVSSEFLWPFSFSGRGEFSFISSNGFLVLNVFFDEFLVVFDISEFGIRPVVENLIFVVKFELDITRLGFSSVEVFHLVVPSSFVLLVDLILVLNVSLNIITPFSSLGFGVVNEFKEITDNSFVEIGTSSPGGSKVSSLNGFGSNKGG